jgi:hypothetical protein
MKLDQRGEKLKINFLHYFIQKVARVEAASYRFYIQGSFLGDEAAPNVKLLHTSI